MSGRPRRPGERSQAGLPHDAYWSRHPASAGESMAPSRRRDGVITPILRPMSAIASQRARSSHGSTAGSSRRRSRAPRRRSSRVRPICRGRWPASKRPTSITPMPRTSANGGKRWCRPTSHPSRQPRPRKPSQTPPQPMWAWPKATLPSRKRPSATPRRSMQLQGATFDFHTLAAPYDAMVTARLKELGSALAASEAGLYHYRSEDDLGVGLYRREQGRRDPGRPAGRDRSAVAVQINAFRGRSPGSSLRATASTKSARLRSRSTKFRRISISVSRPRSISRQCGCRRPSWCRKRRSSGLARIVERCGPSRTDACSNIA